MRRTCDKIWLLAHYSVLFSIRIRVRLNIIFANSPEWTVTLDLVSGWVTVYFRCATIDLMLIQQNKFY